MGIIDIGFRTITCNGPKCDKTITIPAEDVKTAVSENPWLQGLRVLQTGDGRNFTYCCDLCEIDGVSTGQHNLPEQKKIVNVEAGAANLALKQAAAAVAAQKESDRALKAGSSIKLEA